MLGRVVPGRPDVAQSAPARPSSYPAIPILPAALSSPRALVAAPIPRVRHCWHTLPRRGHVLAGAWPSIPAPPDWPKALLPPSTLLQARPNLRVSRRGRGVHGPVVREAFGPEWLWKA